MEQLDWLSRDECQSERQYCKYRLYTEMQVERRMKEREGWRNKGWGTRWGEWGGCCCLVVTPDWHWPDVTYLPIVRPKPTRPNPITQHNYTHPCTPPLFLSHSTYTLHPIPVTIHFPSFHSHSTFLTSNGTHPYPPSLLYCQPSRVPPDITAPP